MDDQDHDDYQPNQQRKSWCPGYVYVIDYGDGKTFKIGHTTNHPIERLNAIARGSVLMPMHLVMSCDTGTSCKMLEELLHMLLDEEHVRGEWFKLDFMRLLNVYDGMRQFGQISMYQRWYELVPADYKTYLEYYSREDGQPFFSEREKAQCEAEFKEAIAYFGRHHDDKV